MKSKGKVFVGMSGGVDSSVAALLLKERGYGVVGVFMRSYNIDGCEEADAEDARRVAGKLGVPFYVWDFEEEYRKRVVDYMVKGYKNGLTPNPDVMCNKEIKFGLFLEKALSLGADFVATGHYVRLATSHSGIGSNSKNKKLNPIGYTLLAARDAQKDQSYFLWTLTQKQLKRCIFPIGDYKKPEVRAIAKKAGLPTAEKKDSQGICFLGKVTLAEFLGSYLPAKAGAVLNIAGEVIGKHSGAQFYTIGQRHGLDSGNWKRTPGASKPFYVVSKNVKKNTIVAAEGEDDPSLRKKEVELAEVNFINPEVYSLIRANKRITVFARVRYRQPLFRATLTFAGGTQTNTEKSPRKSVSSPRLRRGFGGQACKSALLVFDKPQKFVAAGQSAVFYDRYGRMLGGGIIV